MVNRMDVGREYTEPRIEVHAAIPDGFFEFLLKRAG
jgi:hypothetical protein